MIFNLIGDISGEDNFFSLPLLLLMLPLMKTLLKMPPRGWWKKILKMLKEFKNIQNL